MYRLDFGLDDFYVDFLSDAGGIRSLASLRSRAAPVAIEGKKLLVASLEDVILSKKAAGRPKDKAVMDILEKNSAKSKPKLTRAQRLELLAQASEVFELELIRSRLRLPMHKRTNFLRVRVPGAPNNGTAL